MDILEHQVAEHAEIPRQTTDQMTTDVQLKGLFSGK